MYCQICPHCGQQALSSTKPPNWSLQCTRCSSHSYVKATKQPGEQARTKRLRLMRAYEQAIVNCE